MKFSSIINWNIFVVVDEHWRVRQDGDALTDAHPTIDSYYNNYHMREGEEEENAEGEKEREREGERKKQRTSRNNKVVKAWIYLEQDQSDGHRRGKQKCRMTFSDSWFLPRHHYQSLSISDTIDPRQSINRIVIVLKVEISPRLGLTSGQLVRQYFRSRVALPIGREKVTRTFYWFFSPIDLCSLPALVM